MIAAPNFKQNEIAETADFSALLIEAHLLINSWVRTTFENAEDLFFKTSRKKNRQFLDNLTLFQIKELEQRIVKTTKNMVHNSTDPLPEFSKNDVEYILSYLKKMMGVDYGYILHANPLDMSNPFLPEATNHNDHAKILVKQLRNAINFDVIPFSEIHALLFLFKNLYTVIYDNIWNSQVKMDSKFIRYWIKLSVQLVQIEPSKESLDVVISTKKSIAVYGLMSAIQVAVNELNNAQSDLELLMAESFVSAAYDLYQEFESHNKGKQDIRHCLNRIYATFVLIAAKSNDYARMMSYADKISTEGTFSNEVMNAFIEIARKSKEKDPAVALQHFNNAIVFTKKRLVEFKAKPTQDVNGPIILSKVIEFAQNEMDEIKVQCAQTLRIKVKENFPELSIKKGVKSGQLIFFLKTATRPFIPKKLQEKIKRLNIEVAPHDLGLHVISDCLDETVLLKALNKLTKYTHNIQKELSTVTKSEKTPKQNIARKPIEPQQVILKEDTPEPYVKPQIIERQKTRPIGPIPAPQAPAPIAPIELHSQDYGFNILGNPPITPVYCSLGAQKAQKTKLFLRWEGIPGCDALVERQFQEMLNPHAEGILTVGTYGQAGAKLWKDPEGLGEDWGQCALRLKRKGASGFMRAIAIPESKITVESNGAMETRYLFKLGKIKHK